MEADVAAPTVHISITPVTLRLTAAPADAFLAAVSAACRSRRKVW